MSYGSYELLQSVCLFTFTAVPMTRLWDGSYFLALNVQDIPSQKNLYGFPHVGKYSHMVFSKVTVSQLLSA